MAENIPETPEIPKDLFPLWEWANEARGLFTPVVGYSQLLLDEKAGTINDEQRRMLESIRSNSATIFDIWLSTLKYIAAWSGSTDRWSKKESMSFEKVAEIVREVCYQNEFDCGIEVDEINNSLEVEVVRGHWLHEVLVNFAPKRLNSSRYVPHIDNARSAIYVNLTTMGDIQIQIHTSLDLRQIEQRRSFYRSDRHFILANLMIREYGKPIKVSPLDDGVRFSFELSRCAA